MKMANRFIALFLALSCVGSFAKSYAANVVDQSNIKYELSNIALKKLFDIGEPNLSQIKKMLSAHDFKAIETMYEYLYLKSRKDIQYEWLLYSAYILFTPENDISIEDLDLWIAKTGSYIAYAARGAYKANLGLYVRGEKYISDTPKSKIDEMQRLHNEAVKDLQFAITKNPSLMPAYCHLLIMAKTSNMPFSTKQILDKAEKNDNRSFWVRYEYMRSLQPRWGGTYEEMSKFAKCVVKYSNLNPRLWSLQGEADADRADNYHQKGNYKAAVELYSQALKFGDRVGWLKYRGICYIKLGKKEESLADFKRILFYNPTDSVAQDFLRRIAAWIQS